MLIFCRFFIFFAIYEDHLQDPKYGTLIVKLRLLSRKNLISEFFFHYQTLSPTQITQFFGNLSEVAGTTIQPPIPLSYIRGRNGNFEFDFSIKILRIHLLKACHITHFAVLHPFLRGPQILLRFIRHLTLIHSHFIKQKNSLLFRIKFKQFHTFNAYSKLQFVFKLYAQFSLQ